MGLSFSLGEQENAGCVSYIQEHCFSLRVVTTQQVLHVPSTRLSREDYQRVPERIQAAWIENCRTGAFNIECRQSGSHDERRLPSEDSTLPGFVSCRRPNCKRDVCNKSRTYRRIDEHDWRTNLPNAIAFDESTKEKDETHGPRNEQDTLYCRNAPIPCLDTSTPCLNIYLLVFPVPSRTDVVSRPIIATLFVLAQTHIYKAIPTWLAPYPPNVSNTKDSQKYFSPSILNSRTQTNQNVYPQPQTSAPRSLAHIHNNPHSRLRPFQQYRRSTRDHVQPLCPKSLWLDEEHRHLRGYQRFPNDPTLQPPKRRTMGDCADSCRFLFKWDETLWACRKGTAWQWNQHALFECGYSSYNGQEGTGYDLSVTQGGTENENIGISAWPTNGQCEGKICFPWDCAPSQGWTNPNQWELGSPTDTVCYHGKTAFTVVFCP
jgi:hypothetical protein